MNLKVYKQFIIHYADVFYLKLTFLKYFNLINSEATEAGNYALTNLRMSYFSDDNWEASVFVNNVFDKEAVTFGYDLSDFGNYSIYVVNPPRWAGVNVKYNWF